MSFWGTGHWPCGQPMLDPMSEARELRMWCAQVFPYRTDPAQRRGLRLAGCRCLGCWRRRSSSRLGVSAGCGETPGGMRHKRCDRTGLHGRWWEEQYGMCVETPSGCSSACGRKRPPGHHFADRVCPAVQELLVCLVPECEEVFFLWHRRRQEAFKDLSFEPGGPI